MSQPLDERMKEIEALLKKEPHNSKLFLAKANLLFQQGKLPESLAQYERASILQPANPHIWTAKGRVLADLGKHKEAAASFSRALTIMKKGRYKIDLPVEGELAPPQAPVPETPTPAKEEQIVAAPIKKQRPLDDIPIPDDIYADVQLPSDVARKLDELEKYLAEDELPKVKSTQKAMVSRPVVRPKKGKRGLVNGIPRLKVEVPKRATRAPVKKVRYLAVVAVVLIITIAGVASIVLFPMGRGMVIDGRFDDWQGIEHAQMSVGVSDPNVDIRSIGYFSNQNSLFIHISVTGEIFSGEPQGEPGKADTLNVFIDSDKNRTTGYDLDGFGADKLIRIYGRFGEAKGSQLLDFASPLDRDNMSAFKVIGSPPAAASGSDVEMQMDLAGFASGFGIFPEMKAYDGGEDLADYPIGVGMPSVIVSQATPPGPSYQAIDDVTLLTVDIRPHGNVQDLKLKVHTTLSKLKTSSGEFQVSNGIATIDVGAISSETWLDIKGDLASMTSGAVAGAWLESSSDIDADALIRLDSSGARDWRKYVTSPPSDVRIDGAFGDWTGLKDDPADQTYKNIDLQRYGAERMTSTVFFYASVFGHALGGMVAPFNIPVVIAKPPKPGNGSGVPPQLPRADGMDNAYVFVDTDQNSATGYSIGEVGAEYTFMLSGKFGAIDTKGLYRYSNGWIRISDAAVAIDYGQIEGSADIPGLNKSVKVLFMLESWDKQKQELSEGAIMTTFLQSYEINSNPGPDAIETNELIIGEHVNYSWSDDFVRVYGNYDKAQSMISPFDFVLTRTRALLCDNGSSQNTIIFEIRTTSSDYPSSTVIISTTKTIGPVSDCRAPPTNYTWVDVQWSAPYLHVKNNTKIWLVIRSNAATSDEGICWVLSTDYNVFWNGRYAAYSPGMSTWVGYSGNDAMFSMHGSEVMPFEDSAESQGKASRYVLGNVVTIGSPSNNRQRAPFDIGTTDGVTFYGYHRSQMIYLSGELGGAGGLITALKFYRYVINQDTLNNVQIWLKEVTQSSYSSSTWVTPEGTLVWSGDMVAPMYGQRWWQIPLQTTFSYSGTNNLMVSIYHQDGSGEDGYSQYRYTSTSPTAYRFITGSSDVTNPPSVTRSYNRPNITIVKGAWQRGVPTNVGPPQDHTRGAGTQVWGTIIDGDYPNSVSANLTTNFIYLHSGTKPVLSFWHYYDMQSGADGGRVLYSIDSSSSFSSLAPVGGYPATCTALGGAACFSGATGGWKRVVFDISSYAANTIRFQFQFASDESSQYPGWYIDDIKVGYPVQIDEVWSYGLGTGGSGGEAIKLYNYGPSSIDLQNWQVNTSLKNFVFPISQTIPNGGYVTLYATSGQNWFADAGDYVRLSDGSSLTTVIVTTINTTTKVDVDYMRYGSSAGIDSQLWGLLWTQSSALPAPASSSQYLKRDTEGSFASVDTGDAGDWSLIPELSLSGIWLMAPAMIPPLALVLARKRRR